MKKTGLVIIVQLCIGLSLFASGKVHPQATAKMDDTLKIYQFSQQAIPRIDGELSDWKAVPDSYKLTIDRFLEDEGKHQAPNKKTLDVSIKIGWVKGLNRLYFLYEANDNFWAFQRNDLNRDILEIVVDGNRSGGNFIARNHPDAMNRGESVLFQEFQNRSAQNYHIFTPCTDKGWTMVWGPQQWLREFPQANYAYNYSFKQGGAGKLILEFYITLYDYAVPEGPRNSVESQLIENNLINLGIAIIDYDNNNAEPKDGFWNLSKYHTMYGNADQLRIFRLMPLEKPSQEKPVAAFNYKQLSKQTVQFINQSKGEGISDYLWDFGNKNTSTQKEPIFHFEKGFEQVVSLTVTNQNKQSDTSIQYIILNKKE